jgi:phosphatidylserine/phosphatidylglycerophosphate/cardiolipin synthase-like enzyme
MMPTGANVKAVVYFVQSIPFNFCESTPSNSEYLVGRESGYLKIFFYISRGDHVKHFVIDVYL